MRKTSGAKKNAPCQISKGAPQKNGKTLLPQLDLASRCLGGATVNAFMANGTTQSKRHRALCPVSDRSIVAGAAADDDGVSASFPSSEGFERLPRTAIA